ncbi:MAG TPA: hypothetical protein VHF27_03440 [Acidimicrobiales bacterium]|nr:hypothetical protein [Acidimicrobiales bacterium]
MPENEPLDVYLNDHLAASAAAIELVERLAENNPGTPLAAHLEGLRGEIEADRATLSALMERCGVTPSKPKQVAGKVLETLSRFRLNERVTGSPDVSRLMELETLSLGIEGKASLWQSLQQVESRRPEIGSFDLGALLGRAVSQRRALEPFKREAAATALSPLAPAT